MTTPQIPPPASIQQATATSKLTSAPNFASVGGQHDRLVAQTEKWVSQTFYGTLLKQMRESPFQSGIFDGGHGGKAFTSLLDQRLADRMSRGAGGKLVNAIVRKIERAAAYQRASQKPTPAKAADDHPSRQNRHEKPSHSSTRQQNHRKLDLLSASGADHVAPSH